MADKKYNKEMTLKCLDLSVLAYQVSESTRKRITELNTTLKAKGDLLEEVIELQTLEAKAQYYAGRITSYNASKGSKGVEETYPKTAIEFFENKGTDTQGFFYQENNVLYIAFRGTDSMRDWLADAHFWNWANEFGYNEKKEFSFSGDSKGKDEKVHGGFFEDYASVRSIIQTRVSQYDGTQIIVCGHSLGAALATLCSLDVQECYPDKSVVLYMYGAPRVGNQTFVLRHARSVKEAYSVRNGSDIVTYLPLKTMGFAETRLYIEVGTKKPWVNGKDHGLEEYRKGIEASPLFK